MTKGCAGEEAFWLSGLLTANGHTANRSNRVAFMKDLSMAILPGTGTVPRIRDEPIARLDRLEVGAKVVRKLIQDDQPFLRFIMALAGLPMKQGSPVGDQSRELIVQPNQVAGGLAQA